MRLRLQAVWIQNMVLFLLLGGIMFVAFLFRPAIEGVTTTSYFFALVVTTLVLGFLVIFFIATIRMRAHAIATGRTSDLLETQKLFVELYRNSPVPYVMIDHRGVVTYPNHAATRLFGLEEESFEGHNIFDMFTVLDDEDGMKMSLVESTFKQGVFVDGKDILLQRADGVERYGLLSIFPYGAFGSHKKGLMTIVDITKQKQIEKAKTEFVSVASHQLRTPVSSMKWNLELMGSSQFGTLSEQQSMYHKKIITSLNKMNGLIDDFLSVSQLELGTKKVTIDTLEVRPFFDSICTEFDGRIAEKNLTLERRFDDRVSNIETDKGMLHMVVNNLVSNATKYTPEGGTIVVQYTSGYDAITISVADNGVGIPPQDQEQLFSKFFRAENARKSETQGTGLGLYIVKLALEHLGGTITVHSEQDKGTVFDVVLPYSAGGRTLT